MYVICLSHGTACGTFFKCSENRSKSLYMYAIFSLEILYTKNHSIWRIYDLVIQ